MMEFCYIPLPVALAYKNNQRALDFSGAALSLDIVGFTAMCEALGNIGIAHLFKGILTAQ